MPAPTLTPEAKDALRRTIRTLRERLAIDLRAEVESTYGLARTDVGDLVEAARERRARLLAHIDEHVRSAPAAELKKARAAVRERVLSGFVLEAAHTLVNRLVLLRHMEALSTGRPRAERLVPIDVVTKGWQSPAYRAWREHAGELCEDATEGYATLLALVFDDLAHDLPGLFGEVGLTRLFPIPPATLRAVVEALNEPALDSAWTDDTTLGWVYQYWNDPERERLDAKINDGGKIEPYEIAAKTQMFTERYMVEWLLQNSLGLTWFAMCKKHGWRPDAEDVLGELDARRAEWRKKRETGEVALDALMPINGALEDRWKYWVPQPIPDDTVERVPRSIHDLKLLDPACGSGHFLVIAFDLLAALYQEEARHRGETWPARRIAESIVENNLHGVDIDPRAVQIAAAGLYVKWRALSHEARPKHVNLVAPALHLGRLPEDDPAVVQLRRSLAEEANVPEAVTTRLLEGLAGVDHLGTLLKVDRAIDEALQSPKQSLEAAQGKLFEGMPAAQAKLDLSGARKTVLERIEAFLTHHGAEGDLGLRLDGEEVAAGLRFLRIVREGTYDVVVGNPPYQGTSRVSDAAYIGKHYPEGKADLYAAFLLRGLDLTRDGGLSALLTMRGWMFLGTFATLRTRLLHQHDLRAVGDFDRGAFDEVPNEVLAVVASVFRRTPGQGVPSVAVQPTPLSDKSYDRQRTNRKRAAVLLQIGRSEFDTRGFRAIAGEPIVYWWDRELLRAYELSPKMGDVAPARYGLGTRNDLRFVRRFWETHNGPVDRQRPGWRRWVPYIKGAADFVWFDPGTHVVNWEHNGFELRTWIEHYRIAKPGGFISNESYYFRPGVSVTRIGSDFAARVHRRPSIFGDAAPTLFPENLKDFVLALNSARTREVLRAFSPGLVFQPNDINRLPLFAVASSDEIYATLDRAFTEHEAARESSIEFRRPGPSPWVYAQGWAARAVERGPETPLPRYEPTYDAPNSADFVCFGLGVAIGRFGAEGEGLLDVPRTTALPDGILFISSASEDDGLAHPACAPLHAAWTEHGASLAPRDDLRTWLRTKFFAEHKTRYENRPIYFPLSSEKKNFVAWISIHRWQHDTLQLLLADYLRREETRLEGQLADLNRARTEGARRADAERQYRDVQRLLDELRAFIASVREIAEKGPPPTGDACPRRLADARFAMDLDDGVMVNSAALWPLLEPQWKDPKKWWKELATAQGRKDYDWAHLAERYFPARVEEKCKADPSLAVAHKRLWRLHAAKAYAWELWLQDEIRPDVTIDEPGNDEARAAFLKGKAQEAAAIVENEQRRRQRKRDAAERAGQQEFEDVSVDGEGDADDVEEAS